MITPFASRPVLSVVIPVHGVEPYLRQCLDSILDQAGPDVEVVAVDDASSDGCPAVLDAYAAADARVRAIHLPANVGLGRARNAGLDRATGEYVWFVDGDDWLPPGSVAAVLAAVRSDGADVLLVDHLRVYDADGRTEPDPSSRLLRGITGAAPLAERPALLGLQHVAWNKVVRRDFLRELGLRFYPGWYEDCPFSHPLLIAAGTVGVLDRICYVYRQRPGGITGTVSARHFDAFDQYERLFTELDRLGERAEPFRVAVFRLMVDHLLVIAGNERRLPSSRRGDFFHRAADFYRRFRPADGYRRPGGVAGWKHRMLGADAYPAYAALRGAYRARHLLRRTGPAAAAPAGLALSVPSPRTAVHDVPAPTADGPALLAARQHERVR